MPTPRDSSNRTRSTLSRLRNSTARACAANAAAEEVDDSEADSDADTSDGSDGGLCEGKSRDEYVEVTVPTPPASLHRYARGWQAYIVAVTR